MSTNPQPTELDHIFKECFIVVCLYSSFTITAITTTIEDALEALNAHATALNSPTAKFIDTLLGDAIPKTKPRYFIMKCPTAEWSDVLRTAEKIEEKKEGE